MLFHRFLRLGIVVAAVALGWYFWRADAEAQHRRADLTVGEHAVALRNLVRTISAGSGRYGEAVFPRGDAISKDVIATGKTPDGLTGSGESLFSVNGGQVRIDGDAESFWIVYAGVSYSACVEAASGTDSDWMGISVNGGPLLGTGSRRAGPVNAAMRCREDRSNSIVWRAK